MGRQLITAAAAEDIAMVITQGLRTWEEQDALYAKGRIYPGKIVTWAKGGSSWHNFGLAFDVVALDAMGKADWNDQHPVWQDLGRLGKAAGLSWGGDWTPKKRDLPHFQYTGGLTLSQCRQHYKTGGLEEVWCHVT